MFADRACWYLVGIGFNWFHYGANPFDGGSNLTIGERELKGGVIGVPALEKTVTDLSFFCKLHRAQAAVKFSGLSVPP